MPSLETPKYWRSLEERNGQPNPAWEGREFAEGAADAPEGETRRDFLKLLGGTAALAGIAGCANPPDKVLPYAKQPVEIIPGNPLHYATTFSRDGFARGMVVAAREGRPIKVEGNAEHPDSLGAADTYDQAQIWHLYDPQRAKLIREGSKTRAWARFVAEMAARSAEWKKDGGAKLRFLVEPSGSPVEADLRKQIQSQYPNARFYAWSPLNQDGVYGGTQVAFGRALEVRYDFKPARTILALDSDFLAQGAGHVRYQREWAEHRAPENELNRT
jgi:molybdopterin-containing oxidoreductase family iron-sulfur binding subunit